MPTPLVPASLRCAHQVNPLGVSPDRVRLSWQVRGEGSGRLRRAYQIRVIRRDAPARDDTLTRDSGRVESPSSTDIGYAGPALTAGGRYLWKVRIWDESGSGSDWSDPAVFEVALDRTDGWHASWIGLGRIRENVSPPTGTPDPVMKALTPAPYLRLIPGHLRQTAARELHEAIRRADWHLTTGFVGVGYLLPVLSSHGYDSTAYRLLGQRSRPSWRYMIENGATTIWERWDGWTAEHGFTSPAMNSFNHYSLGSVGEWLYRYVLGIEPEAGSAGFGRVRPAGFPPASRRPAHLGLRLLPVGPRTHRHRLAALRRPVHLQRRTPAEHHGQRKNSRS